MDANRQPVRLQWTDQFATGSPTIDEQHRQLFAHLNQFAALLAPGPSDPKDLVFILQFLEFLEEYARTHFSYEEQCMERYRCPAHQKNQMAHEHFQQMIRDFKARSLAGGFRREMLDELSRMLNHWVQGHILNLDTELKPCIERRAG